MGLFSLTKKPEEKKPLQQPVSLPEFPSVHEEEMPEFPAYEPTIGEIKKEITKQQEVDIPVREKRTDNKSMFSAQVQQFVQPAEFSSQKMPSGSQPLFVKIERYKEAMHDLNNLKAKISEAERILLSLDHLKTEEDAKLNSWNAEIQDIKQRLLSLDRNLFEG